ncbi:hypothetical protein Tco_0988786 [Tanacetum coccineum]|uniref:Uncharacterized protein n=1 Tax=Tanacetum coccineum TaxID=301880 RepID=A0ABQ5ES48_9ASTR
MPLETIRMFLGVIWSRSQASSEVRPSSRRGLTSLCQEGGGRCPHDPTKAYLSSSGLEGSNLLYPRYNSTTPPCIIVWVRTFLNPILYLVGLKPSWEHNPQRHEIFVRRNEMIFRKFMFAADDDELSFLLKEPSDEFGLPEASKLNTSVECHHLIFNITPLAWKAVVDNVVNRRAQKLLKVVDQGTLDKMLLESQKWAGYEKNLATLESNVSMAKVVPYIDMDLVHSDDMAKLVGRLTTSAIFYGRCAALDEVAKMGKPINLAKIKGYRPTYNKEYTHADNDLATSIFPFLSEATTDPSAPIEALLNPRSLHRPTLSKTSTPSKLATSSPAPSTKPFSPPPEV